MKKIILLLMLAIIFITNIMGQITFGELLISSLLVMLIKDVDNKK